MSMFSLRLRATTADNLEVCTLLEVCADNQRGLTVVGEDALRSNHLIADMADNKTKVLQCWKMAVAEHIWEKRKDTKSRVKTAGFCPSC